MEMNMNTEKETYCGIGRRERRKMVRRWRDETGGKISLKNWARDQNPVGDSAYAWLRGKLTRGRS